MKKVGIILGVLLLLFSGFVPQPALAMVSCPPANGLSKTIPSGSSSHTFSFDTSNLDYSYGYRMTVKSRDNLDFDTEAYIGDSAGIKFDRDGVYDGSGMKVTVSGSTATVEITDPEALSNQSWRLNRDTEGINLDDHFVHLIRDDSSIWSAWTVDSFCKMGSYKTQYVKPGCSFKLWQERGGQQCYAPTSCINNDEGVKFSVSGLTLANGQPYSGDIYFTIPGRGNNDRVSVTNGESEVGDYGTDWLAAGQGSKTIGVRLRRDDDTWNVDTDIPWPGCQMTVNIQDACNGTGPNVCNTTPTSTTTAGPGSTVEAYRLCAQVDPASEAYTECTKCAGDETNPGGIWTAIGCIPRQPGKIAQAFISVGLGAGGGFGLVSTLVAGFLYSISAGDVKRTNQAKEMLTNSLIGLLFIIFSVTILQFIGYNILKIPGFGG